MTGAELSAIGKRLAREVATRPVGGAEYVPHAAYQDLLKDAQALYTAVTEAAKPKAKAVD